jgi:hypothetical protein
MTSVPEAVWNSRTQWGAILAGAFAGFAVVILMSTLGAALGITVGAVSVNAPAGTLGGDAGEKASAAFGIGAAIWILLTSLATGLAGGWVLNICSRRDRPYSSFVFGGITWAVGMCLALVIAAPGVGGVFSGLGAGAGGAATVAASRPEMMRISPEQRGQSGTVMRGEQARALSDEEKVAAKDAADKGAAIAAAAAWVTLGAQLISIAATMFAAGWHRHTGTRVVTEIRPRPAAPMA